MHRVYTRFFSFLSWFNIAAHKAEQNRETICPTGRRRQILRQAAGAQLEIQWQLVSAAKLAASQNKTGSVQFPLGHGAELSDTDSVVVLQIGLGLETTL